MRRAHQSAQMPGSQFLYEWQRCRHCGCRRVAHIRLPTHPEFCRSRRSSAVPLPPCRPPRPGVTEETRNPARDHQRQSSQIPRLSRPSAPSPFEFSHTAILHVVHTRVLVEMATSGLSNTSAWSFSTDSSGIVGWLMSGSARSAEPGPSQNRCVWPDSPDQMRPATSVACRFARCRPRARHRANRCVGVELLSPCHPGGADCARSWPCLDLRVRDPDHVASGAASEGSARR